MSADICSFGTLITSYDLCLLSKCDKEIHCNLYHIRYFVKFIKHSSVLYHVMLTIIGNTDLNISFLHAYVC